MGAKMTNQNCPFCGCEVVNYTEMCIQHPINKCCLSTEVHLKDKWNSRPPHPLEKKVSDLSTAIIDVASGLVDKSKECDVAETQLSDLREKVANYHKWLDNPDNHGFMTWSATLTVRNKFNHIFDTETEVK